MPDWLRLAVGTLTVLRVPPPRQVDRRVAGGAMLAAPVVGLMLAIPAGVLCGVLPAVATGHRALVALLTAALTVALVAGLTRAIHLDGLADTADGLGSGKDPAGALAVMAQSDIGPFGVVTLTLTLLLQVTALALAIVSGRGVLSVCIALVASRAVLPMACRVGRPAARPTGLGAAVAGTVPRGAATAVAVIIVSLAGVSAFLSNSPRVAVIAIISVVAGFAASALLRRRCDQRIGGLTGDTLGALVEVAATVVMIGLAL